MEHTKAELRQGNGKKVKGKTDWSKGKLERQKAIWMSNQNLMTSWPKGKKEKGPAC